MTEILRLAYGHILADNLMYAKETLTYTNLIDSSMHGMTTVHFILNWIPASIVAYVLNPIMSLFTKAKIYRKYFDEFKIRNR